MSATYTSFADCTECKQSFGADLLNDVGLCPMCDRDRWKIVAYELAIDLREIERKRQKHEPFQFESLNKFEKAAGEPCPTCGKRP